MTSVRRLGGTLTSITAVAAIAIASLGLAANPASAAIGSCAITGNSNSAIGVPQQLSVQDCGNFGVVGVNYANGAASQQVQIFPGAGTNGIATWVPNSTGVASLTLGSDTFATSTIARTSTSTTISTPNTAPVGQVTKVLVTVQSASPSAYQPTGQAVVRNANGAVLNQFTLTPGPGIGQAFGYFWWTPTTTGTFFFQATYSGDSNATSSVSPQDTVIVTPSGNTISLTAPGTMTQGVPVTLAATVAPAGVQGSVGFTVNGTPISASIPIVNGVSTFVWTPNVVGQVTLGASYTTNQGGSGSTSDRVTIVAGPTQTDVISLVQPGWGPWNPNGTYTLGNGSSFAFQATTLSGSGVTLSETGPCQVSGLTITIDTGSGQCNLVATSPGGNGYRGVQQGYTVSIIPGNQTAALAAPNSGNFSKGRTIRLQNPSQGQTNAGQNVTWRVTSGGNRCRIRYPSNGAVNLQLQRAGTCNVVARAPGVAGQWNQFRLERSYRAR
jgi:hypothetical protein